MRFAAHIAALLAGCIAGSAIHAGPQAPSQRAVLQRDQAIRETSQHKRRMTRGSGYTGHRNRHPETMAQQKRRSRKARNRARHKAHVRKR